jgi:AI-2 transport protein TqsA
MGREMGENLNVSWLIRAVQEIGGRLHNFISFVIITFVFTVLGLLEVDIAKRNVERLESKEIARSLLQAGTDIAAKFQTYMLVRSVMSVLTGAVIWGVALLAGLELATAWGVIAFVLNYIPFIGPLIATIFPTLFAIAQFESWQLAVTVFLCLNLIQFLVGIAPESDLAQRRAEESLVIGLQHDDPLPLGEHQPPERHHGLAAQGLADDRKGLLSDRLVRGDIIRSVEEALVDL